MPPFDIKNGYESQKDTALTEGADITFHFPLYSHVKSFENGLKAGCTLKPAEDYKYDIPVVFYGSVITRGGCASRPGMAYQNIISCELDFDQINLGFSGSVKAEDAIVAYIANLKMWVFVYDYGYNAPNAEHLEKTHYKLFKIIRDKNPELLIIMVSSPN